MLALDNDYGALGILLQKEAQTRGIPYEQKELNPQGYGDVFFLGLDGRYSAEIKGAGEFAGDPAHCVAQLKAQCQNAEFAYLFTYGQTEPAEDGNSYALTKLRADRESWVRGSDSGIERSYSRRHLKVAYTAQRKILWRIRQEGFHVVECRDLADLAFELCNWYECGTTVGTTFSRLQPEKYYIAEQDKERRDFILSVMGIQNAGIKEERANALADWMEEDRCYQLTIRNLIEALSLDSELIAKQPLRSSLREGGRRVTIGPAAVQKLRTALGC